MIINDTTFYECITSSGNGGAIFFLGGYNSQLNRVCGIKCFGINGQFSYISPNSNYFNYLDYLSISECYNSSIGDNSIYLNFGLQNINNLNSSFNKNKGYVGIILFYNPNKFLSYYCTFYNNSEIQYTIIHFQSGTGGNLSNWNIINNYGKDRGIIYIWSVHYKLIECIFINNKIVLLYIDSGTLTLLNCIINHQFEISTISNPIIEPFNTNIASSFEIKHYSTKFLILNELINCYINFNLKIQISNKFEKNYLNLFKILLIFLINI